MSVAYDNDRQDVAIVSWNENGFWQGDLYVNPPSNEEWEWISPAPDAFFTCARKKGQNDAIKQARNAWPQARLETVCSGDLDEDE